MRQNIGIFLCLLIVGSHVSASYETVSNKDSIISDI